MYIIFQYLCNLKYSRVIETNKRDQDKSLHEIKRSNSNNLV